MDYLQIANSWPVWLCAGACVAIIVVQAVVFAKLCYKNAPLVGLSKADCTKSFKCGMVTAVGPSLSCFIGAISMITVVGGPLAWMRLSMIGAAATELTAASTGAAASACVFIVINAVTGQFTLPTGGAAMGYAFGAAVITSLSFLLLNIGIAGAGAAQASFATLIEPVASVICGVIVLDEKVTLFTIIGIVLILLSVWVNSMHTHEKAPAREKAPAK